ncbi:hypothetical protein RRF57_004568 [Xylaria bambusicola]|uniref:Uncharacterized protein n=1 Tax=Xylaria bambusicola TaxID=326684 RepID=A0AAN7Z6K0_9PEZI
MALARPRNAEAPTKVEVKRIVNEFNEGTMGKTLRLYCSNEGCQVVSRKTNVHEEAGDQI